MPFLRRCMTRAVTLVAVVALASSGQADELNETFDREIAALLARRCLDCHSGPDPKGGLDLSRRERAFAGGDSGVSLIAGQPDESLFWQRINDDEMPPRHPLPAEEKERLRRWIADGARWGTNPIDPFRYSSDTRAGYDWWALQPLRRPPVPDVRELDVAEGTALGRPNAIDAFLAPRRKKAGLTASPEADRATLIRRLSFDLLGLPPTPEEVDAFVNDPAEDAWRTLVERMLDSPHYGERWGRHWLDVVRYGESQGFERDKIRLNSWPYRDWVVQAFNEDLSYDEFARRQIAGDVLSPGDAASVTATGFLVAGAYDEVGQKQQSAAMRAVVRQDELEDYIGTFGQAFLGLTIHCARCHDHKFDPVSQREYYRLAAALGGVRHGEQKIMTPALRDEIAALTQRQAQLTKELDAIERPAIAAIRAERMASAGSIVPPRPLARWTFDGDLKDSIGGLHGEAHGGATIEGGRLHLDGRQAYVSTRPLAAPLSEKTLEAWVSLPNLDQQGGGVVSVQTLDGGRFDAIVFGEREPRRWMAGSEGFVRTQSFRADAQNEAPIVHVAIVYEPDGTIRGYRNGAPYGEAYVSDGPAAFAAGEAQVLFGLRHGTGPGGNRMFVGDIDLAQLYDRALTPAEIALSAGRIDYVSDEDVTAHLSPEVRGVRDRARSEREELEDRIAELQSRSVYAVQPAPPEPAHVLIRGNPTSLGEAVTPGGIAAIPGIDADFGLAADSSDAERRRKLAEWTTAPENPLFRRVMANRVWHYHFGVGLVDSPNDLGFNGGRPSHPELLDFLASELLEHRGSLKHLHRLICGSAAYRQSSRLRADCLAVDAGNRWLWRKAPQRLDAESLRDAILAVAGELNPQVGGPPYQDFRTFTFNSQFYEMIDPVGPEFHRRTIYRTWLRSGRNRLLDTFDCPDPSTTAPRRAVTTTPVQSLALLNNSFVLRMADKLAERVIRDAGDDRERQVDRLLRLAYGRRAQDDERRELATFVSEHGLSALCRAVFNSNEFLFVE